MSSFIVGAGADVKCLGDFTTSGCLSDEKCDRASTANSSVDHNCCVTILAGGTAIPPWPFYPTKCVTGATGWNYIPSMSTRLTQGGTGYPGSGCPEYTCESKDSPVDYFGACEFYVGYGCSVKVTLTTEWNMGVGNSGATGPYTLLAHLEAEGLIAPNLGTLTSSADTWYCQDYNPSDPFNPVVYPITEPCDTAYTGTDTYEARVMKPILPGADATFCCPDGWVEVYDGYSSFPNDYRCYDTEDPPDGCSPMFRVQDSYPVTGNYYWEYTCDNPCGVRVHIYTAAVTSSAKNGYIDVSVETISSSCPS